MTKMTKSIATLLSLAIGCGAASPTVQLFDAAFREADRRAAALRELDRVISETAQDRRDAATVAALLGVR